MMLFTISVILVHRLVKNSTTGVMTFTLIHSAIGAKKFLIALISGANNPTIKLIPLMKKFTTGTMMLLYSQPGTCCRNAQIWSLYLMITATSATIAAIIAATAITGRLRAPAIALTTTPTVFTMVTIVFTTLMTTFAIPIIFVITDTMTVSTLNAAQIPAAIASTFATALPKFSQASAEPSATLKNCLKNSPMAFAIPNTPPSVLLKSIPRPVSHSATSLIPCLKPSTSLPQWYFKSSSVSMNGSSPNLCASSKFS